MQTAIYFAIAYVAIVVVEYTVCSVLMATAGKCGTTLGTVPSLA